MPAVGRLVEENVLWRMDDSAGQGDLHALAMRKSRPRGAEAIVHVSNFNHGLPCLLGEGGPMAEENLTRGVGEDWKDELVTW